MNLVFDGSRTENLIIQKMYTTQILECLSQRFDGVGAGSPSNRIENPQWVVETGAFLAEGFDGHPITETQLVASVPKFRDCFPSLD